MSVSLPPSRLTLLHEKLAVKKRDRAESQEWNVVHSQMTWTSQPRKILISHMPARHATLSHHSDTREVQRNDVAQPDTMIYIVLTASKHFGVALAPDSWTSPFGSSSTMPLSGLSLTTSKYSSAHIDEWL